MIHIYCGDGKGKTTAAIGLAARMAGYGKRVLFVQFLKGSHTGELEILRGIGNITLMRCDRDYGFLNSISAAQKSQMIKCHNDNLRYARDNMESFDMIVLDELCAAYNCGLLDNSIAREIAQKYGGELVLTGRDPDEWLLKRADYVSEIRKIKHPYDRGIKAREGVEF